MKLKLKHGLLPVASVAALALVPTLSSAQPLEPSGIYLGGGIAYSRIDSENFPGSTDDLEDERTSWKGIVGMQVNPYLAIEGQYIDFRTAQQGPARIDIDGWTAGAVLSAPLHERLSIYGKAGALFWDADGRFGPIRSSDDGTDFTYGAGVRVGLMPALDLRIEYERFEMNDVDVDLASANLVFRF